MKISHRVCPRPLTYHEANASAPIAQKIHPAPPPHPVQPRKQGCPRQPSSRLRKSSDRGHRVLIPAKNRRNFLGKQEGQPQAEPKQHAEEDWKPQAPHQHVQGASFFFFFGYKKKRKKKDERKKAKKKVSKKNKKNKYLEK